jgi:Branched-chain amino acid transport protein (AzlD)
MSTGWLVVLLVGSATIAIKATGPLLLGGRKLPERLLGVISLLAPALLAALVAILTLGVGRVLVIDARAAGVAAGALALWLRAPTIVVVAVAALVTVGARAVGMA